MQRINILIIAVIILSVIFFQESGFAETFNVSTTQELRQALLDAATNGQDDIIILADGTYATTDDGGGTFVFLDNENYDLTLQGSSPENVILSGGNTHQILNARTVSIDLMTIKLKNLALKFGYSTESGGGIGTEEKLDIENCIIASNETTRHGGGFWSGNITTLTNSTISDNTAGMKGGGFYCGRTTVTNSIISGNTADDFGGGFYGGGTTVTDSTISDNTANGFGGGFWAGGKTTVTNSTISDNTATGGGGFRTLNTSTVTNSIISGNTAVEYGGGGFSSHSTITVTNSTISGNTGIGGAGGIDGSGTITDCTISGNTTSFDGGGIHGGGNITNSTISENTAGRNGGGIYAGDITTVSNSTVSGNTSNNSGGGIFCNRAAIISNSIISSNTTSINGGGLFADDIITIVNSIIIENIGTGSVFVNTGDTNRIVNSLFVNNGDYDIAGSPEVIATVYNNYIDESKIDILAFKNGNILGGNLDFVDQTNEDYHIGENSVLIDAGTTSISDITFPTTDFDGNDRIMGVAIDIGPYEFITSSCDFFTIPNLNGSSAIICL